MIHVFVRPLWLGIGLQSSLLYMIFRFVGFCYCDVVFGILRRNLLVPIFLIVCFHICKKLLEFTPPDSSSFSIVFLVLVWISFSIAFLVSILVSILFSGCFYFLWGSVVTSLGIAPYIPFGVVFFLLVFYIIIGYFLLLLIVNFCLFPWMFFFFEFCVCSQD